MDTSILDGGTCLVCGGAKTDGLNLQVRKICICIFNFFLNCSSTFAELVQHFFVVQWKTDESLGVKMALKIACKNKMVS